MCKVPSFGTGELRISTLDLEVFSRTVRDIIKQDSENFLESKKFYLIRPQSVTSRLHDVVLGSGRDGIRIRFPCLSSILYSI